MFPFHAEDGEGNPVPGGQLRVYPNGRKVFRDRNNGDPITIGPFPAITLSAFHERLKRTTSSAKWRYRKVGELTLRDAVLLSARSMSRCRRSPTTLCGDQAMAFRRKPGTRC